MRYLPIIIPLNDDFSLNRENAIQIESSRPDTITTVLRQLLQDQDKTDFGSLEMKYELLRVVFMQLIRDIVANGHLSVSKIRTKNSQKVMQVVSYLDSHFKDPYSLGELASRHGFSKSSLCSCFKKATGKTISEYVLVKRIEHGCLLLCATDTSITEVVYETGFNDISFFNRKFKMITGLTPREYRKQYVRHRDKSELQVDTVIHRSDL